MQALLRSRRVAQPQTFEEYVSATQRVFGYYYGDLGVGFLLVHDEGEALPVVRELFPPAVNPER